MTKENIIEVNMLEQYTTDMKEYALYVNRIRMIPSVKDGLKYIHRRIIYGAYKYDGALSVGTKVKSSAIVGSVMKTMHPHGDASIYDAMKPLTNWYEINFPLLVGKGNWGSFQGDPAAAPRYTECYVSKFCLDAVLGELRENNKIVDFNETYDGKHTEPECLPVKIPLLLINGAFGVGYGLKVDIPSHNINEVIDATLNLIKNPNYEVVLIPDQCMPCDIIETDFRSISKLGNGKFTVRGIMEEGEYKGKPCLHIKSCPDLTFLNTITEKINKLVEEKKLLQIVELVESSSDDQMDFIVVLKKGSDVNFVREIIYKNTMMEKPFSVNFEVLNGFNPLRMSYKSYLQSFIEFRKVTKFRLYCNKFQEVQTKFHEKEAYVKAIGSGQINNIIDMIRGQKHVDDEYLIEYLVKLLDITTLQARYIINANLKELSEGYYNKYVAELNKLHELGSYYHNIIINDDIIVKEIVDELKEFKKVYGKPRNARIISQSSISNIPEGTFKIVITENNFIKKVPVNETIGSFKGDNPKFVITVENTKNVLLFDEQGRVFKLPVHKVPISPKNSNGIDIRTLVKKLTSNICNIMYEPILEELTKKKIKYFVTVLTNNGNIKKLDIEDFLSVLPSGLIYIKLDPDDIVSNVSIVANDLDVIVYSKNKALRMNMEDIPHQKRNSKGMRAISEPSADGLSVIYPHTTNVITITEGGYVNKIDIVALPRLGRNKSGSKVIKLHKGDNIKCIFGLSNDNVVRVITKNDRFDLNVSDIESCSSASVGKKVLPMKNDNIIHCHIVK